MSVKRGAGHVDRESAESSRGIRVDKWLWFARFFKSRSLATDAVSGGLVHINGERTKPSREVVVGDTLHITRGEVRFEVVVTAIPLRRGPAAEAQATYQETPASESARARVREQNRFAMPSPVSRPGKHDRRAIRQLRGR